MDQQHYWEVAERDIEIQNPITDRKLRLLDDYCDIRDGLRVLDVGCGKAWVMRRWAELHDIRGVGLDANRHFIDTAIELAVAKRTGHKLTFVHGDALDYQPDSEGFDIVMCIGATFALGGFVESLEWLAKAVKPGGSIVVGDITLKHPPLVKEGPLPYETVQAIGVIERHGGEVSATISASEADFERYASHHRHSTLVWAREHPHHPEVDDVLEKSRKDWMYFQQTIRAQFGWTIFVARRAG